ncbi:MAG: hypothetical protein ACWA5A_18600 [Marinibacterium sp.]
MSDPVAPAGMGVTEFGIPFFTAFIRAACREHARDRIGARMRILPALALFAGLIAPGLSRAQTFDEAVRANLALGIEICAAHAGNPDAAMARLRAAGFSYDGFDGDAADATHRFAAPADTMQVLVYSGQMAPDCSVETAHMGVTQAVAFIGTVLNQRFPGRFGLAPSVVAPGGPGSAEAACGAYVDLQGGQIPLTISVSTWGDRYRASCLENGTTRFYFGFPV